MLTEQSCLLTRPACRSIRQNLCLSRPAARARALIEKRSNRHYCPSPRSPADKQLSRGAPTPLELPRGDPPLSTSPRGASRSRSARPAGVRLPRSVPHRRKVRSAGTAPAATASSQSWSSVRKSARTQSPPAAKAAIPLRPTSTTRRSATPQEICARSISIRSSSRITQSGHTARASD